MSLLRLVPIITVVLALLYQHTTLTVAQIHNGRNNENAKDVECPNAEDITPCECAVEDGVLHKVMDLMCWDVADEQQLYDIFHSDMPDPTFRRLVLNTENLESLSAEVFGDATFEIVYALWGSLKSVDPETFIKSSSRLTQLDLNGNQLTDFPYYTLSNYTHLQMFTISDNPLISFPIIESETLKSLDVSEVPFNAIPDGALDGLPNLWSFSSFTTNVTEIPIGLFASLSKLKFIDVVECKLTHLTSAQFEFSSTTLQSIRLQLNQITTVDPDTFKGIHSGEIELWSNELTILPEATWKPVLDAENNLYLQGNPLVCGCDVAWLVLEPSYHQFVAEANCTNGAGSLPDLDPTWFENNC